MVNVFADVLTTFPFCKSSSRSRSSPMSGSTSSGRGLNCAVDVMGQLPTFRLFPNALERV